MNLSSLMKIQEQATRQMFWLQQQEIDKLKEEIAELKKTKIQVVGFHVKGGGHLLNTAFRNLEINMAKTRENG